jgi:hypothetical protein
MQTAKEGARIPSISFRTTMGTKVAAIKFGPQDKRKIKGFVKHTRTGACTAKGKCYHGKKAHQG